ncbi:gliding motility-associated ABC transporter ATP-binding subunit GldA [Prolixibacter sp. NT017]|uniref:gliding motility-associated ABC transporter ATP-binding subunit GldA n=1 Tax=Prolixibacter sp. NT017 TaxID=2652390 RepID=UPI00127593FB|nr:gliding motility-associated ABC transporter ATP-binding subunit GldA [Prolixibacter sp. NT017]GET27318.1 gliding motility-associated ABC transporter ATP-binding subunit GldA [Prolixibacter sp. NT017]
MSIQVENITKLFGEQKALDDVTFSIHTGEVTGFLGPNGAGKSTMMKIITGLLTPSSGNAVVNDLPVREHSIDIRRQIGYLPENNPLYPDMYIREYLESVAGMYPIKNRKARVEEMIELTGLTPELGKKIGSLSKGFRQRVGIAQALIHDPGVLILDEPTSGLDPAQLIEIRRLIQEVSRNKTVMLSTHIMQEVEAICNRVLIINKGRIVADKDRSQFHALRTDAPQLVRIETQGEVTAEMLGSIDGVEQVEKTGESEWLLTGTTTEDIRPAVFRFAAENGFVLLTLQRETTTLEKVFLEVTGN